MITKTKNLDGIGTKIRSNINYLIISMRPLQWTKNGFVFVPALFSGVLFSPEVEVRALLTFILFCFVSSGVYLVNDILDIESDKHHPVKKNRPLASGLITIKFAAIAAIILQAGSISVSFLFLGNEVAVIMFIYSIINVFYSLGLKNIVILDAFIVSSGFILRILAGTSVTQIPPSPWILLTTLFLALFISFGKRRSELSNLGDASAPHRSVLANYSTIMLDHFVSVLGAIVIINYSMYTVSDRALRFGNPYMVYTVPVVAFGILRYFYLIHAEGKGGNPIELLLKDKQIWMSVLIWALMSVIIIYWI